MVEKNIRKIESGALQGVLGTGEQRQVIRIQGNRSCFGQQGLYCKNANKLPRFNERLSPNFDHKNEHFSNDFLKNQFLY